VTVWKIWDILCRIDWFTYAFWQTVWIANILVSYPDHVRESDWKKFGDILRDKYILRTCNCWSYHVNLNITLIQRKGIYYGTKVSW